MAASRLLGPYSSRVLGSRLYPAYDEGASGGLPSDIIDGTVAGTPVFRPYYPEHFPLIAAGITEPDYLWPCDEASGNLLDRSNNPQAVLTAGTNCLYNQLVTGWSRPFVGIGVETAGSGWHATIGQLWNMGSQSVLVMLYAAALTSNGNRCLFLGGGNNGWQLEIVGTGQATSFVSARVTGTFVHENPAGVVYPFVAAYDRRGAGDAYVATNKEKIQSTWVNLSDQAKGLGAPGIAAPISRYGLVAVWVGANAEAMFDRGGVGLGGKTLISNLGWPMAY